MKFSCDLRFVLPAFATFQDDNDTRGFDMSNDLVFVPTPEFSQRSGVEDPVQRTQRCRQGEQ